MRIKFLLLATMVVLGGLCTLILLTPAWLSPSKSPETAESQVEDLDSEAADFAAEPEHVLQKPFESESQGPLERGIASYESQDLSQLERCLAILRTEGSEEQALLLEGMLLKLSDKPDSALQAFHAAAQNPKVKGRALSLAGEILYRRSDYVTAAGVLQAAILADPSLPGPHRLLAAWYYDTGAMDNALFHLIAITKLAPDDPRPWRLRGLILHDFERHPEAVSAYREALQRELKPHVAQEVRLELAESLLATRNPKEALAELMQVDDSPMSLALKADCYLSLGLYDQANLALREALETDPDYPRALMIRATLAREQGDKELAVQTLNHAVETHPFDFDFRFQLAAVLKSLGRSDEASIQRAEMERLRSLRDEFTELHHQSMQNPSSADLRVRLGKTAEKLGKWELAASWYQAALGLDPQNTLAKEGLAALSSAHP